MGEGLKVLSWVVMIAMTWDRICPITGCCDDAVKEEG
jgi:hypothetical protein